MKGFKLFNILIKMSLVIGRRQSLLGCKLLHPLSNFLIKKEVYSPSTIVSYLSAISYIHKMDIQDRTTSFLIRKLLKGCNNLQPNRDCRLPITELLAWLSEIENEITGQQ
jgi:hypothetical protein